MLVYPTTTARAMDPRMSDVELGFLLGRIQLTSRSFLLQPVLPLWSLCTELSERATGPIGQACRSGSDTESSERHLPQTLLVSFSPLIDGMCLPFLELIFSAQGAAIASMVAGGMYFDGKDVVKDFTQKLPAEIKQGYSTSSSAVATPSYTIPDCNVLRCVSSLISSQHHL